MTPPKLIIELHTKIYADSLHENSRNRRDLSTVLIDWDNEFDDHKATNLDSIEVNRNSPTDNKLANKNMLMIH